MSKRAKKLPEKPELKRCPRCHVHIQHVLGKPCKGMTALRERTMVAALSEERLMKYYMDRWKSMTRNNGNLYPGSKMSRWHSYAKTQHILWAVRRGMLAETGSSKQAITPVAAYITPEGEQVATSILLRNGLCPQCEGKGLQRCEDDGELLGLGCLVCGGMFEPRVVARSMVDKW